MTAQLITDSHATSLTLARPPMWLRIEGPDWRDSQWAPVCWITTAAIPTAAVTHSVSGEEQGPHGRYVFAILAGSDVPSATPPNQEVRQ